MSFNEIITILWSNNVLTPNSLDSSTKIGVINLKNLFRSASEYSFNLILASVVSALIF